MQKRYKLLFLNILFIVINIKMIFLCILLNLPKRLFPSYCGYIVAIYDFVIYVNGYNRFCILMIFLMTDDKFKENPISKQPLSNSNRENTTLLKHIPSFCALKRMHWC